MSSAEPSGEFVDAPASGESAAKPPRPLLPLSRILLFLLLALMIGAWVVDHRARGEAQAAFERLQTALGEERHLENVSRADVHKLVGRAPVDDGNPDDVDEQFSWQGVPYKHSVFVMYTKGADPRLKDISLNQKIH